jgi:hypothetical protein
MGRTMDKRLMYLEGKSQAIGGRGRIGWVEKSNACRVYRYAGLVLRISAQGLYNCYDAGSGEPYLVTDPKANGRDKIHGGFVDIDDDAREEYWLRIRNQPDCVALVSFEADSRPMAAYGRG